MGDRPSIRPPHPSSTLEDADSSEFYFPLLEQVSETGESDDEIVSRRPLSVSTDTNAERPSKRVRKGVDDSLATALNDHRDANREKHLLDERRFRSEERRAEEMLSLEKERVKNETEKMKIEKEKLKIETENTKVNRAKEQRAMAEMFQSFGLSPDEIMRRLDAIWE